MNNFDEARQSTEEMFANDNQQTLDNTEMTADDQNINEQSMNEQTAEPMQEPAEDASTVSSAEMENAVQTAQRAAEVAMQKNNELENLKIQLQQLQQANNELHNTISQMSDQQEETIVEDALEPPVLDVNSLAFADEETLKQAQADYSRKMADYSRLSIMKDLEPVIERLNQEKAAIERDEAIKEISKESGLENINGDQLDIIIKNNPELFGENIPSLQKYLVAALINKGITAIKNPPQPPKEPTTEELMQLYNSNQDFRDMVEKQRIGKIKESQQVPAFSASSGAANIALNIKEKPKTMEEARERTLKGLF